MCMSSNIEGSENCELAVVDIFTIACGFRTTLKVPKVLKKSYSVRIGTDVEFEQHLRI